LDYKGLFFTLTDVTLPNGAGKVDCFSVRRDAISLVIADCVEAHLCLHHPSSARYVPHKVSFLLEDVAIDGTVGMLENVEVSDYVLHHTGFHLVRNCVAHGEEHLGTLPLVFINSTRVIGVSEMPATMPKLAVKAAVIQADFAVQPAKVHYQ